MRDVFMGLVGVAGFGLFGVGLAYVGFHMLREPADGLREREAGTVAMGGAMLLLATVCACIAAWLAGEVGYTSGWW